RIRSLYYLSVYNNAAGDHDEALRLGLECLRLTDDSEGTRISRADWLIGSILYQQGLVPQALMFGQAAVEQSQKDPEPGVVATTAGTLAQVYESISDDKGAEHYLQLARDDFERMPPGYDRTRIEILLGLTAAKLELSKKNYAEVES